ncbi:hypothetical protein ACOI9R_39730, partial [Mesorhizobium japonicum]
GVDRSTLSGLVDRAERRGLLRRRIAFPPGQRVLVLGATGNAGRLAVPIASRLGAGEVVAVARDAGKLSELPALGAS